MAANMQSNLRPYQIEGINFLLEAKRAILGDEMGLGKTAQSIVASERSGARSILIVCPNIVKTNWQREISRWTSGTADTRAISIVQGDSMNRAKWYQYHRDCVKFGLISFLIVNYESFRRDVTVVSGMKWDVIIYDEAHRLKDRGAKTFKSACKVKSSCLYLLTGTPIINHAEDLWTLLRLIDRKKFGSYWKFVMTYCHVFNNGFGMEVGKTIHPDELRQDITPMFLRREKTGMPEKIYTTITIDLHEPHHQAYREMRDRFLTSIHGQQVQAVLVLAQITRLRQICIDPALMLGEPEVLTGAKIEAIKSILDQSAASKVVIFTQFASAARALARTPEIQSEGCLLIIGDTPQETRQPIIDHFGTSPDHRVLICTVQTAGLGVDMTCANVAIFLDRPWSPALIAQAEDRLHRYPQKGTVFIYSLAGRDTIEERIERLLEYKFEQAEAVIGIRELQELL